MASHLLSEKNLPPEVYQALRTLDNHLINCNRVEIVDGSGRGYINLNVTSVGFGLQDGMDTLKIFLVDSLQK